ncbi:hypothetical protein K6Y74_12665 [Burkholderia cenocepacia]|uniref:hypothetical protein n=1 Tax=Burkholderia cenocepacia TaxID=95486 RepID=UPI00222EAC32|nr:hypothetical protein [Burkholderia cenocepacia]MCW3644084.1 hypothetical protein [Burkholderia cenocepacia]
MSVTLRLLIDYLEPPGHGRKWITHSTAQNTIGTQIATTAANSRPDKTGWPLLGPIQRSTVAIKRFMPRPFDPPFRPGVGRRRMRPYFQLPEADAETSPAMPASRRLEYRAFSSY